MPTPPRHYEISFRLTKGNSGQQKTVIRATDSFTARRIFAQQNPGCAIVGSPLEVKRP